MELIKRTFLLIVLVLFVALVFPGRASAVFLVPRAFISIEKQALGGEGVFDFSGQAEYGGTGLPPSFSVEANTGGNPVYTVGAYDNYTITELPDLDWHLESIHCTSSLGSSSIRVDNNAVIITPGAYDVVNCIFTNSRAGQKSPVLIVPGVLGSVMKKDAEVLWPDIARMINPFDSDSFMDPLQFSQNLMPTESGLIATGLVMEPFPGQHYFDLLIQEFATQGYQEGVDLFTFPYDWRYGVSGKNEQGEAVNVKALEEKIQEILSQTNSDKVDVIAHSTGGLLVKKYAMEHLDDHHIGKAVFVGVPNLGAPKAVKVLVQGDSFGVLGLSDAEMKKIGQNIPVTYDLAPSEQYFDLKGSFFKTIDESLLKQGVINNLNYQDTWNLLTLDRGANEDAFALARDLHVPDFEDFAMESVGIDFFNIVGCKSGTIGKIIERRYKNINGDIYLSYDAPEPVSGDATVPYESANSNEADPDKAFYALKPSHGKMLSTDGIRQKIVNLIAGTSLDIGNKIITREQLLQNPNQCKLKGKELAVLSPLDIEVRDQDDSRLGVADDGSLQNDIPGADFNVFGDHKFVYLPDDEETYTVSLKGTGEGKFTLKNKIIEDDEVTGSENFIDIPVTASLLAQWHVNGNENSLDLDFDGDGTIDETLFPRTILNSEESQDLVSPITTASIDGAAGQPGFYRSDVNIALSAIDPVIQGEESRTSGVFKIFYQLDGGEWMEFLSPINVTTEGQHTFSYYSVDNAGNREPEQIFNFIIDKTAPEAEIVFDPEAKDLKILGLDNFLGTVNVIDNGSATLLADKAGNTTELEFKEKSRKYSLRAELLNIYYNGSSDPLDKNRFLYTWAYDRIGQLQFLEQLVLKKKDFLVSLSYNARKDQTKIVKYENRRTVAESKPGLVLLRIQTKAGELRYVY